jgi:hypothetical protein
VRRVANAGQGGGDGAHRGWLSTVSRRKRLWAAAFNGGGGAPVTGGDGGVVL